MKIDALEIYHVRMPLRSVWHTAVQKVDFVETVLLKMTSGDQYAWSEAAAHEAPYYGPEWAHGVFVLLRDWFGPAVLGKQIDQPSDLDRILSPYKGNLHAKGALDFAWWALDAKMRGVPVYRALGAKRNSIEVGDSLGSALSIDSLIEQVNEALELGYKRIKLKFFRGWEYEMLHAVRSTFPNVMMHIDCNGSYDSSDIEFFKCIDKYNLLMIEQPFPTEDLVGHAKLARAIETPICLDESVTTLSIVQEAIRLGSCKWMYLKLARIGGFTPALAIHDECRNSGIACAVGSSLESAVGSELNLAFAMLDNVLLPAAIWPSDRHFHQDLAEPPMVLKKADDGFLRAVPEDLPGMAREPNLKLLNERCLYKAELGKPTSAR